MATTIDSDVRQIDTAFVCLRQVVANYLENVDPTEIFRVRWRLYHGWYSGRTKTADLRAFEKFREELKTTTIHKISLGADIVAATTMLCGGRRMPLYDTLRPGLTDFLLSPDKRWLIQVLLATYFNRRVVPVTTSI